MDVRASTAIARKSQARQRGLDDRFLRCACIDLVDDRLKQKFAQTLTIGEAAELGPDRIPRCFIGGANPL